MSAYRTFIDEQADSDAEARRLIFGTDPLSFDGRIPLTGLAPDTPVETVLTVARVCELPRDGAWVRFEVGAPLAVCHYGVTLVDRWIREYGLLALGPELPPEGGADGGKGTDSGNVPEAVETPAKAPGVARPRGRPKKGGRR